MVDAIFRTLRDSLRAWRRTPWLAAGLAATLAIGVGAAAGMTALTDRVLLRPIPLPHPRSLVLVGGAAAPPNGFSALAWYSRTRAFTALCQFTSVGTPFTAGDRSGAAYVAEVSPGFFRVVGVRPRLGRGFSPAERSGGAPVAIVSERLWRRDFAAGPIMGRTLVLDSKPFVVIGVMPAGFSFPARTSVWVPRDVALTAVGHEEPGLPFGYGNPTMVGRLRRGVSDRQATMALAGLMRTAFAGSKFGLGRVFVAPLASVWGGAFRSSLDILLIASALLWLVACADAGWMVLVRAAARRGEAAVRVSLGAGRGALLAQLVAECGLLVAAAACGAMGVALALFAAVRHWGPAAVPGLERPLVGPIALGVVGLSVASLLVLSGVGSAALFRGAELPWLQRQPFRGSAILPRVWAALVIAQVGATLALAGGAGVLLVNVRRLSQVQLGFSARGVASVEYAVRASAFANGLPPPTVGRGGRKAASGAGRKDAAQACAGARCGGARRAAATAVREANRRVLAVAGEEAGVRAAAIDSDPPLLGAPGFLWLHAAGTPPRAGTEAVPSDIGGAYFRVMRIPVLFGRTFSSRGGFRSPRVAIVSATLAKRLWGRRDAVGRHIRVGSERGLRTVVGVVGAVRSGGPASSAMGRRQIYFPIGQPAQGRSVWKATLLIRPRAPGAVSLGAVRRRLYGIAGVTPLEGGRLSAAAAALLEPAAFWALVAAGAAALVAALAWLGTLGLFANWVAEHRREIGIRMALGATPGRILRSVLRRAALVTAAGVTCGWLGGSAEAGLLAHMVYRVQPLDGRIWTAAAAFVAAAAFAAALVPGFRAATIEPARELRRN